MAVCEVARDVAGILILLGLLFVTSPFGEEGVELLEVESIWFAEGSFTQDLPVAKAVLDGSGDLPVRFTAECGLVSEHLFQVALDEVGATAQLAGCFGRGIGQLLV